MSLILKDKTTILFQGDSITDRGRIQSENPAENLGLGYPYLLACLLGANYPDCELKFVNRAISGHRTAELKARWQEDCVDINADIVSILIGINDTWRAFDSGDPTTAEQYEENYRYLLEQASANGAQLVVMEPFLLPNEKLMETPEIRTAWRADLDPKIGVARKLAREFEATFVPLDGLFAAASVSKSMEYWLHDGVHATDAGHGLITQAWLEATGL